MIDPKGRVVMVSGANRGIGAAVAKCLYNKGYIVSLGARDVLKVEALTVGWDPDRVLLSAYDARDESMAKNWVAQTVDRFGRLDGIVNNAARYSDFTIEYGDIVFIGRRLFVHLAAYIRRRYVGDIEARVFSIAFIVEYDDIVFISRGQFIHLCCYATVVLNNLHG